MPVEVQHFGRAITHWADQICEWHLSHVSNGPTEAVNNLAKRVKRIAFEIVNFRHATSAACSMPTSPTGPFQPTIQP